jgi:hypothetical protein
LNEIVTSELHSHSDLIVPWLRVLDRLIEFVVDIVDPAAVVAITDCGDLFVVEQVEKRADEGQLGAAELKGLAELEIQPVTLAGTATAARVYGNSDIQAASKAMVV